MKYVLLLLFCSCSLMGPSGQDLTGIPVAVTARILRDVADDIEIYDVNKDGVITEDEAIALGLAVGQDIYQAILRFNAETGGN